MKNADIYSKENIQELQRNRENNKSVSENNSKIKAMNKKIGEKRTIESVESSERFNYYYERFGYSHAFILLLFHQFLNHY